MKAKQEQKNLVIALQGGIGKHILATSFIKWISEKHPNRKLIVASAYPEVFEYNPHCYRNFHVANGYLFEDYIKDAEFIDGEPYHLEEYYRDEDKMHITKLYPKAYRFNEYNENPQTEVYLTAGEINEAQSIIQNQPIITLQNMGGTPQGMPMNVKKMDDARVMPPWIAQLIISELNSKGYKVMQVRTPTEPQLPNTLQFNGRFRQWIAIGSQIKGHIGIDSSMLHAVAVFKKPMLIFWGATHKDNLGYEYEGALNKWKVMTGRPAVSMPDNMGQQPYVDPRENEYWNYTREEIISYVDEFVKGLEKNKEECKTCQIKN